MRKQRVSVSIALVRILLQYASSRGLDPSIIQTATGLTLDQLENPDTRVPVEQLSNVWRELARRSGDQDFGLHVGEMGDRLSTGGILSSVMMNCSTVGKALEKLAHYHDLATDFVRLRFSRQRGIVHCVWEQADTGIPLDRHYAEAVFCGLIFPLRRLTQGQLQPVAIHLTHHQPDDTIEHRRLFGCPLVFDSPRNELLLRSEDWDRPILLANAQLLNKLEQFAQEMLDRLYPPNTWAEQVVHLVSKSLACGEKPALDTVAGELAIGPRQLQNKLKEEGVAYQTLLDDVRKEMALKYLSEPHITVCDIAFLLGFSEQSAFNHAFKRWTGATPGDYRR
ncbi:MAG: AraC family transcriptional regulator [Anaerolineae bacterium]|nr:AraC family transcriptional regulator [Anaerolineae bacterium]